MLRTWQCPRGCLVGTVLGSTSRFDLTGKSMWSCKTSRIPAAESEELSFEVSALKISALNLNLGGSIHAVNWQARVPS